MGLCLNNTQNLDSFSSKVLELQIIVLNELPKGCEYEDTLFQIFAPFFLVEIVGSGPSTWSKDMITDHGDKDWSQYERDFVLRILNLLTSKVFSGSHPMLIMKTDIYDFSLSTLMKTNIATFLHNHAYCQAQLNRGYDNISHSIFFTNNNIQI